jgi:hypothetical protein
MKEKPFDFSFILRLLVWNNHRAETASGKDINLIFCPELIVFNPKMTIFIEINREIKK